MSGPRRRLPLLSRWQRRGAGCVMLLLIIPVARPFDWAINIALSPKVVTTAVIRRCSKCLWRPPYRRHEGPATVSDAAAS